MVLVSPDHVGPALAGPGVRYAELAQSLSAWHHVSLLAPFPAARPGPALGAPLEYDPARPGSLERLLTGADVVIAPPLPPALAVRIARSRARWIADLYNPEPFEGLVAHPGAGRARRRALDALRTDRISFTLRAADEFICGNERQRDMWLGYLAATRRIGSARHDRDPELRGLITIAGAGLPDAAPAAPEAPVLRGAVLPAAARIVIWNGGIWPWLDLDTVIDALAQLRAGEPGWVLVVAGAGRPGRPPPAPAALDRARERLGDGGLHVASAWTDYALRGDALLEADVGVCCHGQGIESRFAERIRFLDLVWAGVPIVCSEGDPFADVVADRGLGHVVARGDSAALAAALARAVDAGRGAYRDALAAVAEERRWSRVAQPLAQRIAVAPAGTRRVGAAARVLGARHRAASAAARRLGQG